MKLKGLILAILAITPSMAFASNSVISFMDTMTSPTGQSTYAQTETPNPALSIVVADQFSHTVNLSTQAVSSLQPIIYLSFRFNGTGPGCIVRLMNSTNKASWAAYPVAAGDAIEFGINPNEATYFQYSSAHD